MADEFVLVAERFAREDRVAADDDGVLEAAALDQALFHQRLDFLVKNEGAGQRDVLGVIAGLGIPRAELRVLAEMVGVGATHLEAVRGPRDDVAAVAAGDAHGLGAVRTRPPCASSSVLPALLEHLDEKPAAAVADGRLVGVDLDERVVDAAAAQGGKQVLDGVNLDAALAEGGGALDLLDVVDVRGDGRLVGQVGALEDVAGVGRGRLDRERDFGAGVEGGTLDGLRMRDGGLLEAGHKGRA